MTNQPTPSSLREEVEKRVAIAMRHARENPQSHAVPMLTDTVNIIMEEARADRQRLADEITAELPKENTIDSHRHPIRMIGVPQLALEDVGFNEGVRQCRQAVQRCLGDKG